VRFCYPSDWKIEEECEPERMILTLTSSQAGFWSLYLFRDRPDPRAVVEAVLEAFTEAYEELDVYKLAGKLCARRAVARDVDFVCHDLLNTACLRACRTPLFTALVLYQGTEHELVHSREDFERVTRSLALAEGAPPKAHSDEG
jgi:hypothetical protein